MRILVTGLSTRAIAESAVKTEHEIVTLDYFGDRDQRERVENHALMRDFDLPFSARGLLQASRSLSFDAFVYISNLENHPAVVETLAQDHLLLGNPPGVLREVRDWGTLRTFCTQASIPFPPTLLHGEEGRAGDAQRWLRKPVRGGGGHGIRWWDGSPPDEDHFLQAYVEGRPASAAFAANGERCVLLGLSEQLIGREELGAHGFAWCGNILPLELRGVSLPSVLEEVDRIATRLTRRFGLRGVNGIDLLVSGEGQVFLVEVNPRYTASMELMERALGLTMFSIHLHALEGRLPDVPLSLPSGGPCWGKGIVYARRTVTVPETAGWVERNRRDVPFPGEEIEAGHPVCTVLAEGLGREACWSRLVEQTEAIRHEIGDEAEREVGV